MCNIGNPQSLGQKPITFYRQVLALCDFPDMLDRRAETLFLADVRKRARDIPDNTKGGTGAYSPESKGVAFLREMVAAAGIEKRDGHPCDADDLWLTDGASVGCHYPMKTLIRDANDAMLVPYPPVPAVQRNARALRRHALRRTTLRRRRAGRWTSQAKKTWADARAAGKNVRALVVINPRQPHGRRALDLANQKEVVAFCEAENLLLVADEVYQENVYAEGKSFTSFKKVMRDAGRTSRWRRCSPRAKGFTASAGAAAGTWSSTGSTRR